MAASRFVGLMSGTSMDAIDAALVEFDGPSLRLLGSHSHPWPPALINRMRNLTQSETHSLDDLGQLDALAGECFAEAASTLLRKLQLTAAAVSAIGCHGQTIRHRPDTRPAFTLQIGDPNRIVQHTGITTVADFRRRDMAAGGQGAPLVPAFHALFLAHPEECRVVLNIGGIANITVLPAGSSGEQASSVTGFDTGPGNCLLDNWISRRRGMAFDDDGAWAAQGRPIPALLERLLRDPYFDLPAPKSTGTEYFSHAWLAQMLEGFSDASSVDVQATLLQLTSESIARAIRRQAPRTQRLLVCGGGVHNAALMSQLRDALAPATVESTAEHGLDPDWIEAMAFAWLAERTLKGAPGNLPSVTGAAQPVVLGAIYPA